MSLMRQIGWLLAAVLLLALAGAVAVQLHSTRDTLATQLELKNADNAQTLALALSQQRGDAALMELLLAAQFDTGAYRRIALVRADASAGFARESAAAAQVAPAWFVAAWPIESVPGVAQVSDGWRAIGRVEVQSQAAFAHDELWRALLRSAAWLGTLAVLAGALAAAGVRRIRRPLDATVEQAHALVEGRYVIVDEPRTPELQRVARAMNGMVERVRRLLDAQSAQVEQLRREAHEDRLTGLAQRAFFLQRFDALLADDARPAHGVLVLLRVARLAEINRELGRARVDAALRALADVLRAHGGSDALAGRLNGADFALACAWPTPRAAGSWASALAHALGAALEPFGPALAVHAGAVGWSGALSEAAGGLLARADLALARAEHQAPFTVHVEQAGEAAASAGEGDWQARLQAALDGGRARLAEFPVLGRDGALLHLECPLRVQLDPGGAFEPAARWLPLAARSHLLPALDRVAVELALTAIARDGRARAINLAVASLADGAFAARLRQTLAARPQAAARLWLEVGEGPALAQPELVRAFAALVRPLGVRFGIEHAGHALGRSASALWAEAGIDYVKLDAALLRGVASDDAVRRFAAGTAALLGALPALACAEGIDDSADAQALWDCGLDAITGPWASAASDVKA